MGKTYRHGKRRDKQLRLRAIRREEPDFKRLSRTLFELAEAQLEKEAEEIHRRELQIKKHKKKDG